MRFQGICSVARSLHSSVIAKVTELNAIAVPIEGGSATHGKSELTHVTLTDRLKVFQRKSVTGVALQAGRFSATKTCRQRLPNRLFQRPESGQRTTVRSLRCACTRPRPARLCRYIRFSRPADRTRRHEFARRILHFDRLFCDCAAHLLI